MILGMHHAAIRVTDVERSTRFYRDTLGLELIGEYDIYEPKLAAMLGVKETPRLLVKFFQTRGDGPRTVIEMLYYISPAETALPKSALHQKFANDYIGCCHICLAVADIENTYQELRAKGVAFNQPPTEFELQGVGKIRMTYFRDPDGILLELLEMPT